MKSRGGMEGSRKSRGGMEGSRKWGGGNGCDQVSGRETCRKENSTQGGLCQCQGEICLVQL